MIINAAKFKRLKFKNKEIYIMGMFSSLGGMVGGVVGGMFGGPIGAQIGSMLGGQIGQMLDQMIGQFGQGNVANGLSNCINQHAANVANQHVDNCGLPQFIKDEMKEFIGNWLNDNMQNVPSDCQNACNNVYDIGTNNQSQEGNSCTRSEGNGTSSTQDSRDIAQDAIMTGACESEEGKEGKSTKGNWLVALAGALATVQNEFLSAAMEDMKIMENNASQATHSKEELEGMSDSEKQAHQDEKDAKRDEFIQAQSRYQANMQMFNMIANMTATSLKSLGEGMTAIARKQ
ncbi:MAG: hypothetical protein AB2729_16195 [Candidatus Thiodiazotropha taylori]